jgi:hypothetical protein
VASARARVQGRPGIEELIAGAVREARELIASCRRSADAGGPDLAEKMALVAELPGAMLDLGERLAVYEGSRRSSVAVGRRPRGGLHVVQAVSVAAVVALGVVVPHPPAPAGAAPVSASPSRPVSSVRALDLAKSAARTGPGRDRL